MLRCLYVREHLYWQAEAPVSVLFILDYLRLFLDYLTDRSALGSEVLGYRNSKPKVSASIGALRAVKSVLLSSSNVATARSEEPLQESG